ncbi:hypothetical protein GCM10009809_41630 [Isoptericola hypogeus]|uniref:HTH tetR-type domain-containing protein n=1 Tax=Isoptericola hypogeus TaxID=300179 RepID=A0ABN2JX85_9MICO
MPTPVHQTPQHDAQPTGVGPGRVRGPYRTGRARQKEILEEATVAFARDGYRGGSLRDIAGTIGVSAGTILHHFGSKEQLLIAVLEHRDRHSGDTVKQYTSSARVVDGVRRIVIEDEQQPGLMRLYVTLAAEAVSADHPAHDYFVQRYATLSNFIVEALRREGYQPPAGETLDDIASLVLSTIDGLQLQWLLNPNFSMIDRFDSMLATHGLLEFGATSKG